MDDTRNYLKLPFDKFDSVSLEALPDEVFFSKRFVVSEEDQKTIDKYTVEVNGRKMYKSRIVDPIYRKYAAMTNPKPGEPGSRQLPLVRFGKMFVYNSVGRLSKVREIVEDEECPHLSPEKIERFRAYARKRSERKRALGVI